MVYVEFSERGLVLTVNNHMIFRTFDRAGRYSRVVASKLFLNDHI